MSNNLTFDGVGKCPTPKIFLLFLKFQHTEKKIIQLVRNFLDHPPQKKRGGGIYFYIL